MREVSPALFLCVFFLQISYLQRSKSQKGEVSLLYNGFCKYTVLIELNKKSFYYTYE